MGTSSTYGGPSGKTPLLPSWAQPEPGVDQPPADVPQQPPNSVPPNPLAINVPIPTVSWTTAKSAMTRYASSGGGSGGRAGLRKAGDAYVGAKGGSSGAARTAISGRAATGGLAQFLSDVANRGGEAASRALGLAKALGKGSDALFAALVDALAPPGNELEQAAARRAVEESIEHLYAKFELEDGDINKLDALDADGIKEALGVSVCSYIYHRWLQELGKSIQTQAITPRDAVRLEREVRAYVREAVKLDFKQIDVLTVRWNEEEGRKIVNRIYMDAYAFLEVE